MCDPLEQLSLTSSSSSILLRLGIGNRSSTVPSKQLGRNDDGGTLNISVDEISGIETSSSSTITTPRDASSTSADKSFVTGSSDTGSLLNDSDDDF
eukprot:scaffold35_cov178-Alexandrium_tamarense.AAC.8